MIANPNPTDYPEVEKFCEWLYTNTTAHLHSFPQLQEAFSIGLNACHSRDGGIGSELISARGQARRLQAIIGRVIEKLKEIESDPRHKAKAADIKINAPLALMQQAMSAQAQLLNELLAIQDPESARAAIAQATGQS